MATVRAIGTDALLELGVLEPGETMTASQGAIVLLRFQNQLDAWAADRLTLSLQLRTAFTLTSGSSTITLGPVGATVTMDRPVWLNTVNYLIPGTSPAVEVPIGQMDEDAYAALSIKSLSSALPLQCFYQTNLSDTKGSLFFWPCVSQDVDIALYSPQAVGVPASLNTDVIGPPGYADAFMYALALRLCTPFGVSPPPLLTGMADRAMTTMKRPNVTPGILGVDPALTMRGGSGPGAYNILSNTEANDMATPVLVNGATGLLATAIFVRGESCNVLGYHIYNASNATAYVQFFDTQAPTVGTTVPKWSIAIPTVTHAFMSFPVAGLYFSGGLWVAATTTAGGSSAPSSALNVNLAMS